MTLNQLNVFDAIPTVVAVQSALNTDVIKSLMTS